MVNGRIGKLFKQLNFCYFCHFRTCELGTAGIGAFVEEFFDILTIKRSEKTSHLHFYFHDIVSGKNPSSIKVISLGGDGIYGFGKTFIFDDALTVGPNASSKVIGRAQGIYSIASQSELALLMVLTFEFIEGKYNGSSKSILGRNSVPRDVREMPIVGGTGLFRFARGYALAHTFKFDIKSGDATVEYNVFVQHFGNQASLLCLNLAFFFSELITKKERKWKDEYHPGYYIAKLNPRSIVHESFEIDTDTGTTITQLIQSCVRPTADERPHIDRVFDALVSIAGYSPTVQIWASHTQEVE
uniref:Dirigent protein n=1 Tax=Nicotiana sylvestris TaxID=4096 RepID=A0A1U7WBU6_NICSY|nr:PREDICTED: dirigent protein 3-like [Nicotiana sylvestris]